MTTIRIAGAIVDREVFQKKLEEQVISAARNFLEGAARDLTSYAANVASDSLSVLAVSDHKLRDELLDELVAQLRVLGEKNRIRANNEGWSLFEKVTGIILRTVLGVAYSTVFHA